MASIDDLKSFASLTSGLLARKGTARPAMRHRVDGKKGAKDPAGVTSGDGAEDYDGDLSAAQADLGWNDYGEHEPEHEDVGERPLVVRQQEQIEAAFAANDAEGEDHCASDEGARAKRVKLTPLGAPAARSAFRVRADLPGDRRSAFTLRVDHERHLRLRLACTLQNRSAQQVVTEALDRLLDEMPGLADLARRARRH